MSVSWRMEKEKQGKENRIKNLLILKSIGFFFTYSDNWGDEKVGREMKK
mgnify:CR=1 FL=1